MVLRGRFRFGDKQNVTFDLQIRRVQRVDGKLVNVFVDRRREVDHFWVPPGDLGEARGESRPPW